ncbi:hypothetical protein L195_g056848, partial [Trifolium pratense]
MEVWVSGTRYGTKGGRFRDGGRQGSSWWRVIASIREGGGEHGGRWFGEHVVRRTKLRTVDEVFSLGWGSDGAAWAWRRQLRAWEEEMLGEYHSLLPNISLQAQSSDRWQWQPDPDTGYSVRGAYQLLTTLDSVTVDDAEHLIWHPR